MKTLKNIKSNIVAASLILALLVGLFTGIRPAVTARADGPGDYMSDYASLAETQAAERALNQEIANEGFVLLKNDDEALPLKTRQVTIMGNGVRNWRGYGLGSGVELADPQSPVTALQQAGISYTLAYDSGGTVFPHSTGTSSPAQPTAAQLNEWSNSEAAIIFISRSGGENISNLDGDGYYDLGITGIASPTG
ncbi:MAG: hypothetical protein J6126_02280, partial [Clostridia bacterium]|nr:hypothetical protein [Clostridia bacterium]